MSHILIEGLFRRTPHQIDCPPDLRTVQSDMREIGWREMWRGRIPRSAIQWQRKYFETTGQKTRKASTWARHIVVAIFEQFLALWRLRNETRHGATKEEKARIDKERTRQRMSDLYAKVGSLNNAADRAMFLPDDHWQALPTATAKAHLSWAEPLLKKCVAPSEHTQPQCTQGDPQNDAYRPPPDPDPDPLTFYPNP